MTTQNTRTKTDHFTTACQAHMSRLDYKDDGYSLFQSQDDEREKIALTHDGLFILFTYYADTMSVTAEAIREDGMWYEINPTPDL